MFDHVGIKSADINRARAFYTQAVAPLGFEVGAAGADYLGIGPKGSPSLWIYAAGDAPVGTTHLALSAQSRAQVDDFYTAALAAGGRDNGAPGLRADYSPTYYAAFVLDPDGHNLEAVCHAA